MNKGVQMNKFFFLCFLFISVAAMPALSLEMNDGEAVEAANPSLEEEQDSGAAEFDGLADASDTDVADTITE